MTRMILTIATLFALSINLMAQDPSEVKIAELKKLLASLKYQEGTISLKNGLAKLTLPETFRYLGPEDAETVLVKIWGNPPSKSKSLGMLVPIETGVAGRNSWAVEIQFTQDGYVKDDDAATIDYGKLLSQMQEGMRQRNPERVKQGYPAMELVGWATPPRYDKATHKMYWAKEIKVNDEPENALNYDIRMLGRRGVLVLTAIASVKQLAMIEAATPTILSMVEFNDGHRYADFNSTTDTVASYGLAALIGGGIAAKTGLFKVIIGALIAAKKFVIVAVLAIGSWLSRFFKGKPASDSSNS